MTPSCAEWAQLAGPASHRTSKIACARPRTDWLLFCNLQTIEVARQLELATLIEAD
jgi:hypothetical protein